MKRFSLLPLLLVSLFTFATQNAKAARGGDGGFFIDETFFPVYVNRNDMESFNPGDTTQVATESGVGADFRTTLGYTFTSQLIVGLTYNMYSLTTTRAAVSGGSDGLSEKTSKSEYGPTLGYNFGNFRMLLTYFLSATKQLDRKNVDSTEATTGDVTIKNSEGSGFQLSMGYSFRFGSSFDIGPSLVYRNVSYKKQSKVNRLSSAEDYAETDLASAALDSGLTPMISMQFRF